MLSIPEIRNAKKRGLKIIVLGRGTWQILRRRDYREIGVDCILEGEVEKVIGKFAEILFKGQSLPEHYSTMISDMLENSEIPKMCNPSLGSVEIGRGCPFNCEFCLPTLKKVRWLPYDVILSDIETNMKSEIDYCNLVAMQDVFLYGSENTVPDDEKILKLHRLLKNKKIIIKWDNTNIVSVYQKPKLFKQISQIILDEKQRFWNGRVDIFPSETFFSQRKLQFIPTGEWSNAKKWYKIVNETADIMANCNFVPLFGIYVTPYIEEREVVEAIELVQSLKRINSLFLPTYWPYSLSLAELPNRHIKPEVMQRCIELFKLCEKHDLRQTSEIYNLFFHSSLLVKQLYLLFGKSLSRCLG